VVALERDGRIEKVPADVTAAWSRVDEAKTHLTSSATLTKADAVLA
jgi:hypothetical protein